MVATVGVVARSTHSPTLVRPAADLPATSTSWRSPLTVEAHRKAVTTNIGQIAAELEGMIGKPLTMAGARIKDAKALGRYAAHEQAPRHDMQRRLRDLYLVVQILSVQEPPEVVAAWLAGSNPYLGEHSPIELLHDGETISVARAAEAFILGG